MFRKALKNLSPVQTGLLGILTLLCAGVVFFQTGRAAPLWDMSYVLENSYRITWGDIPYKDFSLTHAPGTFLVQALIMKIFGPLYFHQVLYCAFVSSLTFLLTFGALAFLQKDFWLNLALALPVAVTGGYGVYSSPNYDVDCSLWMLAALVFFLWFRSKGYPAGMGFWAGILAGIPPMFKQNTGLVFLLLFHGLFFSLLTLEKERRRGKIYGWFFFGALTVLSAQGFLVYFTCGFEKMYFWMFTLPALRRVPDFQTFIHLYWDGLVWLDAALWMGAFALIRKGALKKPFSFLFPLILFLAPILIVPVLGFDRTEAGYLQRSLNLWQVTLLGAGAAALAGLLQKPREKTLEKLLVLLLGGVVNASFLSQGVVGSTYGIFPFLSLLWCLLYLLVSGPLVQTSSSGRVGMNIHLNREPVRGLFLCLGILFSAVMAMAVRSNARLDYVDLRGGPRASSLPILKGLNTPGPWIPEMEELFDFARREISPQDPVILFPEEEPFYFALQRKPLFPILDFDWSVNPFKAEELVGIAETRRVKWLIVKKHTQIQKGRKYESFLPAFLADFGPYKELGGYVIYKRKKG